MLDGGQLHVRNTYSSITMKRMFGFAAAKELVAAHKRKNATRRAMIVSFLSTQR